MKSTKSSIQQILIKPQYIEYHLDLIIQIQIVLDDVECLTFAGDFPLDFPLPWMSRDPVQWHRALHRATQVHQLLRPSLWIHASPVYTVQSRLSAIQNKVTCWKAEVFQVYMIGSNYSSSYAFLNKRGMVSTHNFFSLDFTFQFLSNLKCSVDSQCIGIGNATQMTVTAYGPLVKY